MALPVETQQLMQAIGIATATVRVVNTVDEAIAAAREIGYPVALKAAGPEILHKSDIGGVVLDVTDDEALRSAFAALAARVGPAMTAVVVQQMVRGGFELLLGAVFDPTFGPLVACGSGGVLADLLHDTVFRIHPLTDIDAAEMIDSLKGAPVLRGHRGQRAGDEAAAVNALLRVSALLEICPEIRELDINPLKVLEQGVRAVDVRIRVSDRLQPISSRRVSY